MDQWLRVTAQHLGVSTAFGENINHNVTNSARPMGMETTRSAPVPVSGKDADHNCQGSGITDTFNLMGCPSVGF